MLHTLYEQVFKLKHLALPTLFHAHALVLLSDQHSRLLVCADQVELYFDHVVKEATIFRVSYDRERVQLLVTVAQKIMSNTCFLI